MQGLARSTLLPALRFCSIGGHADDPYVAGAERFSGLSSFARRLRLKLEVPFRGIERCFGVSYALVLTVTDATPI